MKKHNKQKVINILLCFNFISSRIFRAIQLILTMQKWTQRQAVLKEMKNEKQ